MEACGTVGAQAKEIPYVTCYYTTLVFNTWNGHLTMKTLNVGLLI
jgi:hypothetical protein